MRKYRKKPVIVEAMQFTGDKDEACRFMNLSRINGGDKFILIWTLEGNMICRVGDWIIKGVAGEFYPCAPDIFEATYEEINNDN